MKRMVYEIELYTGAIYRVFCKTEKEDKEITESYNKDLIKKVTIISAGIHTVQEFLKINNFHKNKLYK